MAISTILLAILAIILATYYLLFRRLNYFKANGIPHIRPVPVLGNLASTFFYRMSITELLQKVYNIEPEAKYVGLYSLHTPVVVIRDPELIKTISVKSFESFPNHPNVIDDEQDPFVSKNLVALRGQRWREVRTLLSPSFTTSKIKGMCKLMTHCATNFTEFLVQQSPGKSEIDMKDAFTRYTTDVIASCAFGIQVDSMKNPKNEFFMYGTEATAVKFSTVIKFTVLKLFPKLLKWTGIRVVSKHIAEFFKNTVKEIIETRDRTGITQPDMLQLMMDSRGKSEDRKDLTIEEMASQAFVFFLGGFETSSSAMCFAAYEIATNPDVQEKLQKEIDDVLNATSGQVTYEAVNGMTYLAATINETLRMYPVAFTTDRICEENFEIPPALPHLKPLVLEKGMNVWIPIFALHRDPKYFKEPNRFNPERFLDENKKSLNSNVYMPFGKGPRMCIGNRFALLEIKVLFFYLLARCNLKPCSKTKIPLQLSKKMPMFPEGGFWLNVEPRDNCYDVIQNAECVKTI